MQKNEHIMYLVGERGTGRMWKHMPIVVRSAHTTRAGAEEAVKKLREELKEKERKILKRDLKDINGQLRQLSRDNPKEEEWILTIKPFIKKCTIDKTKIKR